MHSHIQAPASLRAPLARIIVISFIVIAFTAILINSARAQESPAHSGLTFLPGDAAIAPATGMQIQPRVAAGDNMFLVVWTDSRTKVTDVGALTREQNHEGSRKDIYAARMDANGSLIDQTPIVVAQGAWEDRLPNAAWNGANWLVVWSGETGQWTCCPEEHRYAARVSPEGVVLDDPALFLVAGPGAQAWAPAGVGSDGSNWLVAWPSNAGDVRVMRVAPDGSILDPGGVTVAPGTYPLHFDIAFAGGEYFLIWSDNGAVLGQRILPDLTPIGYPVTINAYSSSKGLNCSIATDGTNYFVTWLEDRDSYRTQVAGARVSYTGVVMDPNGIFLTAYVTGVSTPYKPRVAFDGTNYVVVYRGIGYTAEDIYAARVTPAGVVLDYDVDAIPVSAASKLQLEPDVAALPGAGSQIVWIDHQQTPLVPPETLGDIFGATMSPSGAVGTETCISVGAPTQTLLRLVPNGTGHLAVYRSATSGESSIKAQRLDASGSALDPEPITVVSGGDGITNPSASWNGSVYLVVWEDYFTNQIWGRRLDAGLAFVDAAPFPIMPGNMPDVAASGDLFLTVTTWEEPHEIRRIYFARVQGSDGTVLDPTPTPITDWYFSLYPRVAAVGARWLVVWQRHPTHDDPWSQANGRFVDSGGTVGELFSVDGNARKPAVIGTGDGALVVFDGRTGAGFHRDIFARRLLEDGTYLDPIRGIEITHEPEPQFEPVVAWNGNEYVVAYADFRNEPASPRGDLFASRVATGGTVLDPGGFIVAADAIPEIFPQAAAIDDRFIIGGSIFRSEANFTAYRVGISEFETITGVPDDAPDGIVPRLLSLAPNPFDAATTIQFDLPRRMPVELRVVDVRGAVVRELLNRVGDPGPNRIVWDGTNDRGQPVAAGVYFVHLRAAWLDDMKKLVVLK